MTSASLRSEKFSICSYKQNEAENKLSQNAQAAIGKVTSVEICDIKLSLKTQEDFVILLLSYAFKVFTLVPTLGLKFSFTYTYVDKPFPVLIKPLTNTIKYNSDSVY